MATIIRIRPGQPMRGILDDSGRHDSLMRQLGFQPPHRASHVERIESGPNAWGHYVDMSPLGPETQFCLWPPLPTRREALAREHEWLEKNWL